MRNLLIIGAGEAGRMVAREIQGQSRMSDHYQLLGFLDDDNKKKKVDGVVILGSIEEAPSIIKKYQITDVIIAIPSAGQDTINRILNSLPQNHVQIKIIPGLFEIIQGDLSLNYLRSFEASDLLGREEIGFDREQLLPFYKAKTVLVTGGGGSIGSEIVRQLLNLQVERVVAMGHGENSIHTLINEVGKNARFSYVIGDIRDPEKLAFVFKKFQPQVIFHAAAHKHVPLMEEFPDEAVKNNILGTYNVAKAAIQQGVSRFILVSTDKAVNPTSVMGASKRVAERLVLSLNHQQKNTHFSLTRFGNVMGSRGSVIPLFQQQIRQGGPLTVTHPDITRYFMSIREAARLVIKSATVKAGNIFVLDMGKPIRILDLARKMITLSGYEEDEIPITFSGLRPGEKLHEEILTEAETISKSEFDKLFVSHETEGSMSQLELTELLKNFEEAARNFDNERIVQLMDQFLPEYQKVQ